MSKRKNEFIKFPSDDAAVKKKIEEFSCISRFPNVVGAIDGSHIEICAPNENAADYSNRNRYYSLVLQGIADANQKFIHTATGFPGSMHDSRILIMTDMYDLASNNEILMEPGKHLNIISIRPLIVGDPAYALSSWLMKPYPQTNITQR